MRVLWSPSAPILHFVLRGALVYLGILFLIRLAGKKEVGQMGAGEFVALLLISNAVQNAMNGGDNSITAGIILAVTILSLSVLISYLTYKFPRLEKIIDGRPVLLIHDGKLLSKNLEREMLTLRELKTRLRRQGVELDQASQAVLENDGSISVVSKAEASSKRSSDA